MARWADVAVQAPELAQRALGLLEAHKHKTMATVRADGSPRISGTELELREGDLWLGSMPRARKALDLRRDPRVAVHSGSDDPPAWKGDAKLSGLAVEVTDAAERTRVMRLLTGGGEAPGGDEAHLFRLDVRELSVVRLGDPADHLVIEVWSEGRGVRTMRR